MKRLIWLVLLASASAQIPTIPIVQVARTSSNVATCAYGKNVVSGNLLVMISVWQTASGTPTVSDTLTSTWTQAFLDVSSTQRLAVYTALAASSGANTVTLTETSATRQTTLCFEALPTWGVTADASTSTAFTGTPATPSSGNITTTKNGDFILGVAGGSSGSSNIQAGSGFMQLGYSGASDSLGAEFKIAGTNGTYNATVNNANTNVTVAVVALRPSSQQIVDASIPEGAIGQAYSYQLTGIGGAGSGLTYSESAGTLQSPLSISSTGLISGTPVQGGTRSITFQIDDGTAQATKTLSLRIGAGLNTISERTTCTLGSPYTAVAGDFAVITMRSANGTLGGVTDSKGTTYYPVANIPQLGSQVAAQVYVGVIGSAGSNTITAGVTGTACAMFSNVQFFIDSILTNNGTASSGTITSPSLTTVVPNELLYSAAMTVTNTATLPIQSPFTADGGNTQFAQGYDVASTVTAYTSTYSVTGNTGTNWGIGIFDLRPTVNNNFVQITAPKKSIGPF